MDISSMDHNFKHLIIQYFCEECGADVKVPFTEYSFFKEHSDNIEVLIEYVENHLSFEEVDLLCEGNDVICKLPDMLCSKKECKIASLKRSKQALLDDIKLPLLYADIPPETSQLALSGVPGVLFIGKVGSGKTYQAVALLKRLIIDKGGPNKCTYLFINSATLYFKYQEEINSTKRDQKSILSKCIYYDFLVIDDVGTEKSSISKDSNFYMIINERLENLRPTIITSNILKMEDVANSFPERLA